MSDLLLNGCSYTAIWKPSIPFLDRIGCDRVVNISKHGGSFQRTCRTTVEYFAQKTKPKFAIIPLTFRHRWELSIRQSNDNLDGAWYPLHPSTVVDDDVIVSKKKMQKLLDQYYGLIPNDITYLDRMFTEIILLSSFLEANKVNYIMFDMCNAFTKENMEGFKGIEKINLINQNKNIINLFEFCGNSFMWEMLSPKQKLETDKFTHHHSRMSYLSLEKYILSFLNL